MDANQISAKVQDLSDVELAFLICVIAKQHCLIQTNEESLDELEEELQLIAANIFNLPATVVRCSNTTTLDDFSNGILITGQQYNDHSPEKNSSTNRRSSLYRLERSVPRDDRKIASVVIARDLDQASHQVQIQTLELLRTGRIFTHTAVHTAPKVFLVVVLTSSSGIPLVKHLNDRLFISHYHDPEDGFPNLEEASEWIEDDRASQSSVVHRSILAKPSQHDLFFGSESLEKLSQMTASVTLSIEVKRYLHDILTFLRRHRAVAGGATPLATKDLESLARLLSSLHGLDFLTPSLAQLAVKKVYRHRITIVSPENERSLQYGSDLAAVKIALADVTAETVIDEVLNMIEVPL